MSAQDMSRSTPWVYAILRLAGATAVVLHVACGGSGGGGQVSSTAQGLDDAQACEHACGSLVACGADFGPQCVAGCVQEPTFLACAREAGLDDCNGLALCSYKQWATTWCGDGPPAGVGTGTCAEVANCEGECVATNQSAACDCACVAGLDPARALHLAINDLCAENRCAAECFAPGLGGAACLQCFWANCSSAAAQCQSD